MSRRYGQEQAPKVARPDRPTTPPTPPPPPSGAGSAGEQAVSTEQDTPDPDVFPVYTVTWEVHNGARWEKVAITPTKDRAAAEDWAERMRTHPRARTRKVAITEEWVREIRTSFLPYWVKVGDDQ